LLKTKRVYDPPSPDDGTRILVDRLWPRGITNEDAEVDEWMKEVAPSNELRRWFSHDPSKWNDFRKRYAQELKGKADLTDKIRKKAEKATVTLLFAARDVAHNNATALKEILSREMRG
jgi:uncharacterized protein YeaO (DUF488 family)